MFRNVLSWKLRQCLTPSRGAVPPQYWAMNLNSGFWKKPASASQLKALEALNTHYPLSDFTLPNWHWVNLEALHILGQLHALSPLFSEEVEHLEWWDIGCKNFGYAPALCAVASTHSQRFHIHGVELDPYRSYEDGHSRSDYARGMVESLSPLLSYHIGDFMNLAEQKAISESADVVSCFLPFVVQDPHNAWGLPKNLFQPEALLQAMWKALKPGGVLIISNLTEDEATVQAGYFHALMGGIMKAGELQWQRTPYTCPFLGSKEETRTLWKLRKLPYV